MHLVLQQNLNVMYGNYKSLYTTYFFLCQLVRSQTPTFRKSVTIPTPRTPTPFKNALAAQEKMHGPLKMEVRAQSRFCVNITVSCAWFMTANDITACSVSAAAAGFSRRRHTRSSEAGNRSGHL